MCNCGAGRETLKAQSPGPAEPSRWRRQPVTRVRYVRVRFTGMGRVRARGTGTGTEYDFSSTAPVQLVYARDVDGLIATRLFSMTEE